MSLATISSIACPRCGTPRETSAASELGCLVCTLELAFGNAVTDGDEPPLSFGQYLIETREDGSRRELGRGAMGVTYRAVDPLLKRTVALKIIKAGFAAQGAEVRERFLREARAAAALRHPNIATAYQFGIEEETGQPYYAMELVEGESLEDRVRRSGPLDVRSVIAIAAQVSAALSAAEKQGLIHRDLKPANLMIASADEANKISVKVIDFGLAKALVETPDARALTQNGFVGTPAFASPEQLSAGQVDVRSDIYSVGATLWYLLTGHMPFGDRAGAAPPPVKQLKAAQAPPRLVSLLVSMLAAEPAARPSSGVLARELQLIQERLDGRRKLPFPWAVTAAFITLAAASTFFFFRPSSQPDISQKAIAVLPFTDSSGDKENSYFTTGMQEEIAAHLRKISGLVALSSRTVAQAGEKAKDVSELRRAVGATHILQGSVHPAHGRVVVSCQLIDARTAKPVWTKKFESDITGIAAVQKEIAEQAVIQLKGKLTTDEKSAIEQTRPHDLEAYELYLEARSLLRGFASFASTVDQNRPKAIGLLEKAVARDPNFALAYALLSEAQADPAWAEDPTPDQLAKAKATAERAVRVGPQVPEAHLILGSFFYPLPFEKGRGGYDRFKDKERGLEEWRTAERLAPNNATVLSKLGGAAYDRGDWKEAFQKLERARQVEPLEPLWASELGDLHLDFRHHAEAEKIADAMIAKLPAESSTPFWNLKRELALARGDTAAAALANEKSGLLKRGGINIYHRMALVALLQHRYAEAARLLGSIPEKARTRANVPASRVNPFAAGYYNVWLGIALRAQGDKEKAEAAFATAEQGFREWLRRYPEEPSALGWLTVCVAGQGRRDDTLREIAKAIETFPLSRNPIRAVEIRDEVANAYAWTGDRVLALDLLQEIVHLPGGPTAGDLKLDPRWDDLREDPRFEKLIAEAAKPIAL